MAELLFHCRSTVYILPFLFALNNVYSPSCSVRSSEYIRAVRPKPVRCECLNVYSFIVKNVPQILKLKESCINYCHENFRYGEQQISICIGSIHRPLWLD